MKNGGWVRLHRKIEDNFLWFLEPFSKAQAWIDLFLMANHKNTSIQIRGNIVPLKRGQIGWSELTMAARWKWSKNKVRRFLNLLETEQQIIQQKDRYITTIITVLNYENLQSDTAERQQKDSRRYINKNDKKEKKVKKEDKMLSYGTPLDTFLASLKENPAYQGIDINNEIHKMNAWLLTPKGKGRKLTHKFILNWLNKCEVNLTPIKEETPLPPMTDKMKQEVTRIRQLEKEWEEKNKKKVEA